jgi:hypothetical protein
VPQFFRRVAVTCTARGSLVTSRRPSVARTPEIMVASTKLIGPLEHSTPSALAHSSCVRSVRRSSWRSVYILVLAPVTSLPLSLNPKSSETAGQGCVLRTLYAGNAQMQPRSKETMD